LVLEDVRSSDRRRALRDVYDLELPATSSGKRFGAAMAVALGALQSR
jgi:hypothetical protein